MRNYVLMGALALAGCQNQNQAGGATAAAVQPQTEEQKTLYALGMSLGRNVEPFSLTPEELNHVVSGMRDQVTGATPAVKYEEYWPKVNQLFRSRQEVRAQAEKAKGEEVVAQALKEQGARKLESGMVFIPMQEGTGASPSATDRVKVHYRGTLPSGKVFDSSYDRGEPATFPLNGVIRCWTEGLQQMKVGGKARLVCPPDVAYGPMGRPPTIPPNSTLNFEVELLEIVESPPQPPPGSPGAPGTARPITPPAGKPAVQ